MHRTYSAVAIILFFILCSAGCLSPAAIDRNSAPVVTNSVRDLAELGLGNGDVPNDFTLTESRRKNATEVSSLALDLGWQDGYFVQFEKQGSSSLEPTVVSQSIALYPPERMKDVLQYVVITEESQYPGSVVNLTDPKIGEESRAYAVSKTAGTTENVSSQDIAYSEIIFTKGPVFEVIRTSGPSADYQTIEDLALKASEKI